jgi:tetratricopeptide (TPR) repeat protein
MRFIVLLAAGCMAARVSTAQPAGSDRLIQFYQWQISRDPEAPSSYDHLGSAYLQKARESGDPAFYALTEDAYRQAMARLTQDEAEAAPATAHLAALYLSEHRFAEAAQFAKRALQLDSNLLSAYATLGDACFETGTYAAAAAAYAKLKIPAGSLSPRPGLEYLALTRAASLDYIHGRSGAALIELQHSVEQARNANLPLENIAWSQFSLGEMYFQVGDFARAEAAYKASLATFPRYHRALAWLARLRAAQGRLSEASDLYAAAIAIIPLPLYAAALGDIRRKMGMMQLAEQQYQLVEFIAKLGTLNQSLYRRELAMFYADHDQNLAQALAYAQAELAQRQDIYTWDVLAWAYYKHGDAAQAAHAAAQALAQGTQDPMLFFHAGMIYEALGERRRAAQYLGRALTLNPNFHIFYADLARSKLNALQGRALTAADSKIADVEP